jgi:hypothetical protein
MNPVHDILFDNLVTKEVLFDRMRMLRWKGVIIELNLRICDSLKLSYKYRRFRDLVLANILEIVLRQGLVDFDFLFDFSIHLNLCKKPRFFILFLRIPMNIKVQHFLEFVNRMGLY